MGRVRLRKDGAPMLIPGKDPASTAANVGSFLLGLAAYGFSAALGVLAGIGIAAVLVGCFVLGEFLAHLVIG